MTTQLDSLRSMTVVVADTGDIDAIKKWMYGSKAAGFYRPVRRSAGFSGKNAAGIL